LTPVWESGNLLRKELELRITTISCAKNQAAPRKTGSDQAAFVTRDLARRGWAGLGAVALALQACVPPASDEGVGAGEAPDGGGFGQPATGLGAKPQPAATQEAQIARLGVALELADEPLEGPAEMELLELIGEAENYSEASLLARVAAGAFAGPVPSIPEELGDEAGPDAADRFVFESWSVTHSEAITTKLQEIRHERDEWVETLTDEEFAEYASETNTSHRALRAALSLDLGRPFDEREDVGVVQGTDGSVWRRKATGVENQEELQHGEPGGGSLTDEQRAVAQLGEQHLGLPSESDEGSELFLSAPSSEPVPQIVGNTDSRDLRSAFNAFDLDSSVWGPKILLTGLNNDVDPPNGTPIDLDCSGTKISRRIVIAVGHCFFKSGAWTDTRRLVPAADGIADSELGADPSPHGSTTSQWRYIRGDWMDHEWTNYDFGLMVLYNDSALKCWWWHAWQENSSGLTQDDVLLYGYPGEFQDCGGANSPHDDDFCFASIYGMGDPVITEGAYRFHYYMDTQPGMSGTGVYKIEGSERVVYGSHRGDYGCCMTDASRLNGGNTDLIQDAQSDHPGDGC